MPKIARGLAAATWLRIVMRRATQFHYNGRGHGWADTSLDYLLDVVASGDHQRVLKSPEFALSFWLYDDVDDHEWAVPIGVEIECLSVSDRSIERWLRHDEACRRAADGLVYLVEAAPEWLGGVTARGRARAGL